MKRYMNLSGMIASLLAAIWMVEILHAGGQHCTEVVDSTDDANDGSGVTRDNCNTANGLNSDDIEFDYDENGDGNGGYFPNSNTGPTRGAKGIAYECYTDYVPPRKICDEGGTQKTCQPDSKSKRVKRVLHGCEGPEGSGVCDDLSTNTYFQRVINDKKCD